MLKAEIELPMSQFTVVVAPTAAVAWVPKDPTMAVSIYWTAVCISCSSMVGQARAMIVRIMALLSLKGCFFDMVVFSQTIRIQ